VLVVAFPQGVLEESVGDTEPVPTS
jgi:hypothetical protein